MAAPLLAAIKGHVIGGGKLTKRFYEIATFYQYAVADGIHLGM
jgi:hypothetical protein